MYDKLASLGIRAGMPWDPDKLDPTVLNAIKSGIVDTRAELKRRSEAAFDPALFFNTREVVGTDYMNRALGVYVGIFGNTTDQSVYLTEVVYDVSPSGTIAGGESHRSLLNREQHSRFGEERRWLTYHLPIEGLSRKRQGKQLASRPEWSVLGGTTHLWAQPGNP